MQFCVIIKGNAVNIEPGVNYEGERGMQERLTYCSILNTNINVTDMQRTVSYIEEHLEELRGQYICIANVHTTVMSSRDEKYRKVQNEAAMALPDGKPLSIVSRRWGYPNAGRVPGPDLMVEIFKVSEERGYTHYFYGSTEHTLELLRQKLSERFPKLKIVGTESPPFRPATEEEDRDTVVRMNESGADFIWVGLGAPKQENWMAAHKGRVNGVMLGVGAGFDFHAGTVKRAPKWMQEICMEWLYRLSQDPKRLLKRYVSTNFLFLIRTFKEGHRRKKEIRQTTFRVAQIGHKRIPSREGGVEIVVEKISERLVCKGILVDAYNRSGYHVSGRQFDTKHNKLYKGIRILTIPTLQNGKLNAIVYSFLASVRALFTHYDVYHYHAEGPCAMLWLPHLFHKRLIVTIHGLDWQRSKWGNFASRVLKFGERMAVEKADEIIVLSKNLQQYFEETYGRKTLFIPNGIERADRIEAKEITQKWGLKKDRYILFLARIVPEKGVHYLLEAFRQIHTDMKLVIAGGSSHTGDYMKQVMEMAKDDDRVVFTHFVQGRKLEELYSNAYCFVLPSDVEGMAISLLEAMSYGNCCVVSDIPENIEVVENYAVNFPKGNVEQLKNKLQELVDHPETVDGYREKAADFICSKYNWDDVVKQTMEVYGCENINGQ